MKGLRLRSENEDPQELFGEAGDEEQARIIGGVIGGCEAIDGNGEGEVALGRVDDANIGA